MYCCAVYTSSTITCSLTWQVLMQLKPMFRLCQGLINRNALLRDELGMEMVYEGPNFI